MRGSNLGCFALGVIMLVMHEAMQLPDGGFGDHGGANSSSSDTIVYSDDMHILDADDVRANFVHLGLSDIENASASGDSGSGDLPTIPYPVSECEERDDCAIPATGAPPSDEAPSHHAGSSGPRLTRELFIACGIEPPKDRSDVPLPVARPSRQDAPPHVQGGLDIDIETGDLVTTDDRSTMDRTTLEFGPSGGDA